MIPKISLPKILSYSGIKQSRLFTFLKMKAPLAKDTVEISKIKTNSKIKTIYFEKEDAFIKSSADYILQEALSNVRKKDFFTISLAGGSTPAKIYEKLVTIKYRDKFPWNKTYFFIGDERILPPTDTQINQSNIVMITDNLFSKVSIPQKNKILPDTSLSTPQKIAQDYEKKIKALFKTDKPNFDLFLLGMGMDCHTASLFPNDFIWRNNNHLVIATSRPIGDPEVFRISMGLPLINQAKNILMLISGKAKKEVANELLKNISEGNLHTKSPIKEIKNQGEFIWHIH